MKEYIVPEERLRKIIWVYLYQEKYGWKNIEVCEKISTLVEEELKKFRILEEVG